MVKVVEVCGIKRPKISSIFNNKIAKKLRGFSFIPTFTGISTGVFVVWEFSSFSSLVSFSSSLILITAIVITVLLAIFSVSFSDIPKFFESFLYHNKSLNKIFQV